MATRLRYAFLLLVLALVCGSLRAADPTQLNASLLAMQQLELDRETGRNIANLRLAHTDFTLVMEAGRLVFAKPVLLDTLSKVYGAYYSGRARVQYQPPVTMEQRELRRFFQSDSLDRQVESAFLLFNDKIYRQLADSTASTEFSPSKEDLKDFATFRDRLTERENYTYLMAALRNLARPRTQPFLAVLMKFHDGDVVMYLFDPYQREEVRLLKHRERFIVSEGMETVCQYSVYLDSTYEQLNGIDKTAITVTSYVLDGTLDDEGDFQGRAQMTLNGQMAGTQLLELSLHQRLEVDSVRDADGRAVNFRRWTKDSYRGPQLWLILNKPLEPQESTSITVYYHGKLGARHIGRLQTFAGAEWYPRYEHNQKATFDITLATPGKYRCVVAGQFIDSTRQGRVLTTRWQVTQPTAAVSFDVGEYERFQFTAPNVPPVVVYHLTALHRDSAGRMMDRPLTMERPETESGFGSESEDFAPQTSKDSTAFTRVVRQMNRALTLDLLTGGRDDESTPNPLEDPIRVGGGQMERQVGDDILASLQMYTEVFGPLPYDTVRVVETMTPVADVVPGIIHLDWNTFFATDRYGSERARRGRGAALQWFGGLVDYATYHDQWLSDGLATYCGMWYLQTVSGQDQFEHFVEQVRKDIISVHQYALGQRQEPGPPALGYRTTTSKSLGDKDVIIYLKGAYILHMLRHMLLDLDGMREDAYRAMLRDYVTLLRDKDATSDLFRQIVEKHAGQDMRWFFDQWVYQSGVPTYTLSHTTERGQGTSWQAKGEIRCSGVPEGFKMYVPLDVVFDEDKHWYTRVLVDQPSVSFDLPPLPSQPRRIILNPFGSVLAEVETK